jgi:DNA-binding XRE family transcriptional regulator
MNKLRIARTIRGLCQHRLAKLIGCSQPTISLLENDFKIPTMEEKLKIAEALNFKPEEIWPEGSEEGQ